MSEAEIDSIIKKYDRTLYKSRNQLQYTERKKDGRDPHTITFMDNNYTPLKDNKQANSINVQTNMDILKRLDECEQKLAVSERNYADILRKYDKLKQSYNTQAQELQKQRKSRLQQLIDLQNKLRLLQIDNQSTITKLQAKQNTIAILKQKLTQKEEEVALYQVELENVSRRVFETLELKNKEIESRDRSSWGEVNNEQANRMLDGMRTKYEKIIQSLKADVANFNNILVEKEKQKKKVLEQHEQEKRLHKQQLNSLKQIISKNQQQYKTWLQTSSAQKHKIIQDYEHKLQQLQRLQMQQKIQKSDKIIQDMVKLKPLTKELESKNIQLQTQIKKLHIQIQNWGFKDKQKQIKLAKLGEELRRVQGEYGGMVGESQRMLGSLRIEEQRYEKLRMRYNQIQVQLESQTLKNKQQEQKIYQLTTQIKCLKQSMSTQLQSLLQIKKQLNQATNNQLNINSTLTQTSIKQDKKIHALQQELEQITTQLYAERLEKAKLMEELNQTKIQLKRQYQLSVQNLRKELEEKIRGGGGVMGGGENMDKEKQQMYLNMFKIQRQYELLRSEVVTADQVLRMGNKMAKFYCNQTHVNKKKIR